MISFNPSRFNIRMLIILFLIFCVADWANASIPDWLRQFGQITLVATLLADVVIHIIMTRTHDTRKEQQEKIEEILRKLEK